MPHVTVVTPCYNEEGNVEELHRRIRSVFAERGDLTWNHLLIDNASTDGTMSVLRRLAAEHREVQVILNTRNFGHIRSPYHALLEATGDAVICMASDLQDPPELIPRFLDEWQNGSDVVVGIKSKSEESALFWSLRSVYYKVVRRMADVDLIEHFTGFGLYDRKVIEVLRGINDPYPYFRGLISEIGFATARVYYEQPQRKRGLTKNNFYTLYDMAMLGVTNHTKIPLRLAAIFGFLCSAFGLLVAFVYLIYKLLYWDRFEVGMAPLLIGSVIFASVQLFTLGIVGEYVAAILTQVRRLPHVVERERINMERVEETVEVEAVAGKQRSERQIT